MQQPASNQFWFKKTPANEPYLSSNKLNIEMKQIHSIAKLESDFH